ncbi:uncharacterized protein EV420DRAFT_342047 [Desarmillaria tabescens]|uniref:Mid2 domain-containing protein n=1 Tax=Armillaria tabescens TaxID=1929756 RepID=A0AA39N6D0_ARMTA|nr:uncharacterized protein EV420DRAFT_342047 [Desarmillaria tabescens]KAK0458960.1 hypothetical protein EV420DRAFT_342047 [Desarmillaria tabescens]
MPPPTPSKISNGAHILDLLLAILPIWVQDYIRGDQQCTYANRRRPVFIHRRRVPFDQSLDQNEGRDRGSSSDNSRSSSNSGNSNAFGFGNSNSGSNGSKDPSTSNDNTTGSQTDNSFTTGSDIFCQFCIADNDARVLYNGPWSLDGAGPSNTTHSTSTAGSTASLSFNGSGIIVFGAVPSSSTSSNPPTTSFTIDAAAPFVTTEPQIAQAYLNQPLFVASELSQKEHKIVINVTDAGPDSPFILDYFLISPHPNSTSNTEATISFPAASSSTSPTPFASAIKSTASSANNVSDVNGVSPAIIKVLAALLGVMFFVIIFLVVFLVIYIRRSKIQRGRSIPRSFKSRTSHQGTLLTTTESIIRNFTPSLIWSYSRSEAGSGVTPSTALPPRHSAKSLQSEARSVWSAAT